MELKIQNAETQRFKYSRKSASNVISGFRQFLYFTAHFGIEPLPAKENSIVLFLELMARTVGYNHLKHLLSSIKYIHLALNLEYPVGSFQIDTTLQGLKRRLAKVPFRVLPITPVILMQMYKFLNMDKTDDLALWCAYLTAFYGLLRKSSTVPERQRDPYSKSLLRRNIRVDENNNMVYLYLGYSKNNNFCTRDVIIPIPGNSNLALDLVRHLKKLFSVVDTPMDSPAFSFSKKQGVTYSTFTSRLKRLLRLAGYDPDMYSGHSFRRGGATFLYNCGGTVFMVQASGDWSSQCFSRYLYLTEEQRFSAQVLMREVIQSL